MNTKSKFSVTFKRPNPIHLFTLFTQTLFTHTHIQYIIRPMNKADLFITDTYTLCRGFWDDPIYHWRGIWWWEYGAGGTHLHTDNAQLSEYRSVNACGQSGKHCPLGEGGHTALQ